MDEVVSHCVLGHLLPHRECLRTGLSADSLKLPLLGPSSFHPGIRPRNPFKALSAIPRSNRSSHKNPGLANECRVATVT